MNKYRYQKRDGMSTCVFGGLFLFFFHQAAYYSTRLHWSWLSFSHLTAHKMQSPACLQFPGKMQQVSFFNLIMSAGHQKKETKKQSLVLTVHYSPPFLFLCLFPNNSVRKRGVARRSSGAAPTYFHHNFGEAEKGSMWLSGVSDFGPRFDSTWIFWKKSWKAEVKKTSMLTLAIFCPHLFISETWLQ